MASGRLPSVAVTLFTLVYVILSVGVLAVGGYVLGYTFRKGWDRAGESNSRR